MRLASARVCRKPLCSVLRHHAPRQDAVAEKRVAAAVKHLIVPPFLQVTIPAGRGHDAEEQSAIALRRRRDFGIAVVGPRREGVEFGAHVEDPAGAVDQRQVDGDAAAVRRSAARV